MEQKEPTAATVDIKRTRPCINEDEECSWSGDEGCLCYPDSDKWVPVVESGEEHCLQDFWSSLTTEEAFYLPKTVKVLIKGDVKEMPIEWLLQKRVEVPEDFGKPKPPVPRDLTGQVLMYEKIIPEEAVAYYYATEGSDKKINGTEPGIAAIDALIDEEYKRGDTSIKIFNEDTGKFEIMSLREAMESSVFFPKEEEKE